MLKIACDHKTHAQHEVVPMRCAEFARARTSIVISTGRFARVAGK
jgi:hypothetical protein